MATFPIPPLTEYPLHLITSHIPIKSMWQHFITWAKRGCMCCPPAFPCLNKATLPAQVDQQEGGQYGSLHVFVCVPSSYLCQFIAICCYDPWMPSASANRSNFSKLFYLFPHFRSFLNLISFFLAISKIIKYEEKLYREHFTCWF